MALDLERFYTLFNKMPAFYTYQIIIRIYVMTTSMVVSSCQKVRELFLGTINIVELNTSACRITSSGDNHCVTKLYATSIAEILIFFQLVKVIDISPSGIW